MIDKVYTALSIVILEILKTYNKNNLANKFIKSFKSPTKTPIFFNKKLNKSLKLCINYRGLNNLTIKNRYFLPLVRKLLYQLDWSRFFSQLDLTNTYY